MADAQDLKSWDHKKSCGFESRHRHHFYPNRAGLLRGPNMMTKMCLSCLADKTHGFYLYDTRHHLSDEFGFSFQGLPHVGVK